MSGRNTSSGQLVPQGSPMKEQKSSSWAWEKGEQVRHKEWNCPRHLNPLMEHVCVLQCLMKLEVPVQPISKGINRTAFLQPTAYSHL